MIAYIKGVAAEICENTAVLETAQGVAYEVGMTPYDLDGMGIGEEVKVYTYLQVKEDGVALYGFLEKDDLAMFKLLITVSGVGPKSALAVLSSAPADELRVAVVTEDVKRISSAPGVGKKTAERIVLELKDKMKLPDFTESAPKKDSAGREAKTPKEKQLRESVLQVLVALGYSEKESLTALRQIEITEGMSEEELTKLVLRNL